MAGTADPPVVDGARRAAARCLVLAGAALLLATLVLPWRPPTLCLLRTLTGLPCPFCGSTTAMVELGRGAPLRALGASPLATSAAPLWALWPLVPHTVRSRLPRGRGRLVVMTGLLLLAELWQLQRAFL